MSLVNDVLRQLDSDSSKQQKVLPLHPLMADEPKRKKQLFHILFSLITTFLLLVLTFQTFYKESIFEIFNENDRSNEEVNKNKIEMVTSSSAKKIMANEIVKSPDETLQNNTTSTILVAGKDSPDFEFAPDSENVQESILEAGDNANDSIKIESNQSPSNTKKRVTDHTSVVGVNNESSVSDNGEYSGITENLASKPVVEKRSFEPAKIKTVENPGFKEYQLALRSYKNKQNESALSWIDIAISKEKKNEYLQLKVRILFQQGSGEKLRQFIIDNNDNTSLSWFRLVAPSLQMYSYYELSNAYYSELVKQQPNEIKWQLAMALNYSKLGLNEKTYSTYKNMLDSSLLTYKQKKWVASRLERMEQSGGVRNEN